jgi:hypothetical protein
MFSEIFDKNQPENQGETLLVALTEQELAAVSGAGSFSEWGHYNGGS